MPKEKRDHSVSFNRSRASPFPSGSSRSLRSLAKNPFENEENVKEWEDARCPVCMEHPHNAILLLCSSHNKGCRPFMCDTSYRHSNCFDQFRKSFTGASPTIAQQEETPASTAHSAAYSMIPEPVVSTFHVERSEEGSRVMHSNCENQVKGKLLCPLCRGDITGWMVVEAARAFMNTQTRNCACETCDFSGTYSDLRKHARLVHPLVRPSEADPERQRYWRRLERQRDIGDLFSTLQSSLGEEGSDEDSLLPFDDGTLQTVYFLIQVFTHGGIFRNSSSRRVASSRMRPTTGLWGERHSIIESSDGGSGFPRLHGRRSRRGPTPDEES